MKPEEIAEMRRLCAPSFGPMTSFEKRIVLALDEREALLAALRDATTALRDAGFELAHCWAEETPPSRQEADAAETAEELARAAITKAEL